MSFNISSTILPYSFSMFLSILPLMLPDFSPVGFIVSFLGLCNFVCVFFTVSFSGLHNFFWVLLSVPCFGFDSTNTLVVKALHHLF